MIEIDAIDHVAITVADIARSAAFYRRVLGARIETFGEGRTAVHLGDHKLNLHDAATNADLVAAHATMGAIDICFRTRTPIESVLAHLAACDVAVEAGPVRRSGANRPLNSVYLRDPDGNLIEIANEL